MRRSIHLNHVALVHEADIDRHRQLVDPVLVLVWFSNAMRNALLETTGGDVGVNACSYGLANVVGDLEIEPYE